MIFEKWSKNQVRNRPKMEFVEIHFLKFIFQKSSADQQGESVVILRIVNIYFSNLISIVFFASWNIGLFVDLYYCQ